MVLRYAREHGLPAIAMCVSTTYGGRDWGRTPHGAIIAGAAFGKLPFVMKGIELEAVGVDDAARALILAAEKGRIGERYLISEKMITNADVARIAAEAAGVPPPGRSLPLAVSYALATIRVRCKSRLRGTDEQLSLASLRLMRAEAPVDCAKARRELGWQPRPVEDSIREAARFWVGLPGSQAQEQAGRLNDARRAVQAFGVWWRQDLASNDVTEKLHVDLCGAPQTMLATFYAKALDADLPKPILGDQCARTSSTASTTLVDDLDHPPQLSGGDHAFRPLRRRGAAVSRGIPEAVVLGLGCGLDVAVSGSTRAPASSGMTSIIPTSPTCAAALSGPRALHSSRPR